MDETYYDFNGYYNSWAYQMSKFRYNQSGIKKENDK